MGAHLILRLSTAFTTTACSLSPATWAIVSSHLFLSSSRSRSCFYNDNASGRPRTRCAVTHPGLGDHARDIDPDSNLQDTTLHTTDSTHGRTDTHQC